MTGQFFPGIQNCTNDYSTVHPDPKHPKQASVLILLPAMRRHQPLTPSNTQTSKDNSVQTNKLELYTNFT